jgi:ATP/maltotriose-dependent transcriptional regulator MalT
MSTVLDVARADFDSGRWSRAYERFAAADRDEALGPDDLERLAVAAQLVGEDELSVSSWERAHLRLLERGEVPRAVRCAFWLATGLFNRGEAARGGGWLGRAQRLLDDHDLDCVERGFMVLPRSLANLEQGHPGEAHRLSQEAIALGQRFGETDLLTLGRLVMGRALVEMGRPAEGLPLLDEAMVAVTTEEVSPIVAGLAYCTMVLVCQKAFDMRRAHEWTAALSAWCDRQPDMVPFRGQCLVHRSEVMQWHGEWLDALNEAKRARDRLSDPPGQPAIGMALYQLGELYRLRGDFEEAEAAYREAIRHGHDPQPGLANLRLMQGQIDVAESSMRAVLNQHGDYVTRTKVLSSCVEIMIAAGDAEAAAAAADELDGIAAEVGAPFLMASAQHGRGAVSLQRGDLHAALQALRAACAEWAKLEAPYEHARSRLLVAFAYRALGDLDTAELEADAARRSFEQLGAPPDVAQVEAHFPSSSRPVAGDLTARQVEVLALVAAGRTNREIAETLVVSEHTVRRHVQNIFAKVGVTSRAAATAFAYKHGLL